MILNPVRFADGVFWHYKPLILTTMDILIANANEPVIREFLPKLKLEPSTANTSTFKITPAKFQKLLGQVREKGFNPFALMYW